MLITETGATRERLVAAAKQLVDEGGPGAVTLREVGRRAFVSHNAAYRHFVNRDALLASIANEDLDDLVCLFCDVEETDSSSLAALRSSLLHLINFARKRPGRYRLMLSEATVRAPDGSTERKATAALQSLAELIGKCQAENDVRAGDPRNLAALVFATAHGLIDLELSGRMAGNTETSAPEEIVELLLALIASA